MLSRTRLLAMARKETIQLRRDPRSLAMAFLLPVALILFFGYAITWDVKDLKLAVLDQDHSQKSRELVESFRSSGYFTVQEHLTRYGQVDEQLGRGRVAAVLVIPPDFSKNLAGGSAPVQLLLDGSDANTATIALNYAGAIVARWSSDVLLQGRKVTPAVDPQLRIWYNPTLDSRDMIVPGLIAVIMMVIAAMLTALTVAREWERGTMEQLAATPVHRLEVIFGKLLPYIAIGLFDVVLTAGAGVVVFGVPFRGNVLLFLGLTTFFLIGALGLGIFISAVARSQVLATQIALIATFLPALLLSGFLFEIANMPKVLQAITFLVPARYYIVVTRGIMLKGVGPETLWIQSLFMIVFAVVGIGLATRVFHKEIQ
ncbi:MAG: ABC transporter permease [Gemmatimonadota bacterium]